MNFVFVRGGLDACACDDDVRVYVCTRVRVLISQEYCLVSVEAVILRS